MSVGDSPINQTQAQYEINRPISNISNDSDIVPVDFDTPMESSATESFVHYPEQVVMSATTQLPDEDHTPHQLVRLIYCVHYNINSNLLLYWH